jgi:hypothetical protein
MDGENKVTGGALFGGVAETREKGRQVGGYVGRRFRALALSF